MAEAKQYNDFDEVTEYGADDTLLINTDPLGDNELKRIKIDNAIPNGGVSRTIGGVLLENGSVKGAARHYSDSKEYIEGTIDLFDAAYNSVYIVSWTGYSDSIPSDVRRLCAIVQRLTYNGTQHTVYITNLATGGTLGGGTVPALSSSNATIRFSGGSGSPRGTVYWLRLA